MTCAASSKFATSLARHRAVPKDARTAANAAIDHMRDWNAGSNGEWVTMGVVSDGDYGIPEGMMFGVPCICANGKWEAVKGLEIDAFSRERIDLSLKELTEERDGVKHLLT